MQPPIISTEHPANFSVAARLQHKIFELSPWSRALIIGFTLLILTHNLLFQFLVLPFLSIDWLRRFFGPLQLLRSILDLLLIAGIFLAFRLPLALWSHRPWYYLNAVRASSLILWFIPVGLVLLTALSRLAPELFRSPSGWELVEASSWQWVFFNSVILAPFREELFFRGYLWQILQLYVPKWSAGLLSALAFSLSHLPAFEVLQVLGLFACGLVLAFLVSSYGLAVCIYVHALFNFSGLLMDRSAAGFGTWLHRYQSLELLVYFLLLTLAFRGTWAIALDSWRKLSKKPS